MSNVVRGLILIGTLLAFVPAALTWKFYLQRLHELERYQEAVGTIVGVTPRGFNTPTKPAGKRRISLNVPLVEYHSQTGRQQGNPLSFSSEQPFTVGERVVVYYDPEKPSAFVLSSRSIAPTVPVIFTLITLVFAGLGFQVLRYKPTPRR